jgi:hypothetical protein
MVPKEAHVGNAHVQARMYATYRREYENFTHLPGESIDALFQRFTVVVNNMRANVDVLPYDDHDRAVKLLQFLDRTIWGGMFEAIVESEKYDTLTVNELFSKLKSGEVDRGINRGGVPDLSVSGDKSDLVVVDPQDPTTTSETRSANAIAEPTPDGYRPCWRKISLITKINSCTQSKNEQESEASNLNITRRWSLNYTTAARWWLFGCS